MNTLLITALELRLQEAQDQLAMAYLNPFEDEETLTVMETKVSNLSKAVNTASNVPF